MQLWGGLFTPESGIWIFPSYSSTLSESLTARCPDKGKTAKDKDTAEQPEWQACIRQVSLAHKIPRKDTCNHRAWLCWKGNQQTGKVSCLFRGEEAVVGDERRACSLWPHCPGEGGHFCPGCSVSPSQSREAGSHPGGEGRLAMLSYVRLKPSRPQGILLLIRLLPQRHEPQRHEPQQRRKWMGSESSLGCVLSGPGLPPTGAAAVEPAVNLGNERQGEEGSLGQRFLALIHNQD